MTRCRQQAEILLADYASTDYASLASLALARMQVENGDFAAATEALQPLVGSAAQQPLAFVARARLAALQMQLEQYDQALATLDGRVSQISFTGLVDELRGDALALQGQDSRGDCIAYRKAQHRGAAAGKPGLPASRN